MGQAGKFLRRTGASDGYSAGGYAHWCPACEEMHAFEVDAPFRNGAKWTFDGNLNAPSFMPSMNIRTGPRPTVPAGRPDAGQVDVCHYFIKNGMIQFLGDCTHPMKGQIIPLPELPPRLRDDFVKETQD